MPEAEVAEEEGWLARMNGGGLLGEAVITSGAKPEDYFWQPFLGPLLVPPLISSFGANR